MWLDLEVHPPTAFSQSVVLIAQRYNLKNGLHRRCKSLWTPPVLQTINSTISAPRPDPFAA